jgi:hypothetical protein
MAVSSSTRKRLPMDQRIMDGIMAWLLPYGVQAAEHGGWQSSE